MIYKPILFGVTPFYTSHRELWVSTLSLRLLTRAHGSIGFYQTDVSNSNQHSNEPLGSERTADEGWQMRTLRKREGKVKAKVREMIMKDIWRWGNSYSLLKKVKNWFCSSYCSNRQQRPDAWKGLPFRFHFFSSFYLNCQENRMLAAIQRSGTKLAERELTVMSQQRNIQNNCSFLSF